MCINLHQFAGVQRFHDILITAAEKHLGQFFIGIQFYDVKVRLGALWKAVNENRQSFNPVNNDGSIAPTFALAFSGNALFMKPLPESMTEAPFSASFKTSNVKEVIVFDTLFPSKTSEPFDLEYSQKSSLMTSLM
jgi:hypothetical protein